MMVRFRASIQAAKSEARALAAENVGISEIARRVGVNRGTVSRWVRNGEIPKPPVSEARARAQAAQVKAAAIVRLGRQGYTVAEIREATGFSETAVRHFLKKHNVTASKHSTRQRPLLHFCENHGGVRGFGHLLSFKQWGYP